MSYIEKPVEIKLSLSNPIYKGADGLPGRDGAPGVDGKSAYEIAVQNGFIGTETEWLASLKGADGTNGRDGANGVNGTNGRDGITPVKGVDYFTEQDIQNFITQIPETVEIRYIKAWYQTVGSPNDLRTISDQDKTVLETIYQNLITHPDKTIILWLGANNGNYPLQFNISTEQMLPCLCKIGELYSSQVLELYPICNSGLTAIQPLSLFFTNGVLDTNKLNFQRYEITLSTVKGTNPIDNTSTSLETILTSMNNTYAPKSYVEQVVRGIETGALKRSVVQSLPTQDIGDNTIYMVPKTGSTGDVYNEYLYVNNAWEHIGSTDVDLTNYATKSYVDGAVFSGDYNDLTNKPTIPNAYVLPISTTAVLGGVKVDGNTITVDANGVISAVSSGNNYTAGTGISISNDIISSTVEGLPTNPINDGSYLLKCVVSSGSAAYSWESVVIGGSY